jgi:dihydroxyacetone kinase-like protein
MYEATKLVDAGAGVYIVKNYTGDILNFEMAARWPARTQHQRETIVMNDDVAVKGSLYRGRRGVGAVLSRSGGAAARPEPSGGGPGLAGAQHGRGLTSCTVPAAGKPTFSC